MDLALNLGKTVSELEHEMTVVEYDLWRRYASKYALPWRRTELYLAQVALKIAQVMGGNGDAVLADYMFDPEEDVEDLGTPEGNEEAAKAFFGFNPRNVKEE